VQADGHVEARFGGSIMFLDIATVAAKPANPLPAFSMSLGGSQADEFEA